MPRCPTRLMTLAPGHFHAALVHREMHRDVHRRVHVYAPLDDDTVAHVARLAAFNSRAVHPTAWELDLRTGPDFLARFLREQPGSAVVLAGRNAPKIDFMLAAVRNGCHVLADKPWVIDARGYAKLPDLLREAELRELVVSDMMTERHEIAARLLRDLLRRPGILGDLAPGTGTEPTLQLASVHYLMKTVAGQPLRRPAWWFDADVAGTAIADVGTHLVDLALWLLFPWREVAADEVEVRAGRTWATALTLGQFTTMTGLREYPPALRERWTAGDVLNYQGNGAVDFAVRGVSVRATVTWEAERRERDRAEGNTIAVRGTNAVVEARSVATPTNAERPELVVTATDASRHAATLSEVRRWCAERPEAAWGLTAEDRGSHLAVLVPDRAATDHESHFQDVFDDFHRQVRNSNVPAPEPQNLAAKYLVTTAAVELASGDAASGAGGSV